MKSGKQPRKAGYSGNNRFKEEMERLLKRRTRPLPRGGDHRSAAFREREG